MTVPRLGASHEVAAVDYNRLLDGQVNDGLVYYGATTGWKPPWNLPWGWLDRKILTGGSTSTSGTAVLTVLTSATLTLVASRRVRATVNGAAFGTVASDRYQIEIQLDGVQVEPDSEFFVGSTTPYYPVHVAVDSSPAAGSRVWTFKATRVAGTGVLTFDLAKPVTLLIEDIGPDGAAPTS